MKVVPLKSRSVFWTAVIDLFSESFKFSIAESIVSSFVDKHRPVASERSNSSSSLVVTCQRNQFKN